MGKIGYLVRPETALTDRERTPNHEPDEPEPDDESLADTESELTALQESQFEEAWPEDTE